MEAKQYRVRVFIRKNELSSNMIPLFGSYKTVRDAVKKVRRQYPTLGPAKLYKGLFWEENYKQITVDLAYAAREQIAMLVIELGTPHF